jgi:hypothetical protein
LVRARQLTPQAKRKDTIKSVNEGREACCFAPFRSDSKVMARVLTPKLIDEQLPSLSELRARGWNVNTCGAVFGLLGGLISPLIGSILTAISWISGPTWHGFAVQRVGTVLLFLTIPLLLFGAHCLDRSEKKD